MKRADLIGVVEAAYCLVPDDGTWLASVIDAAGPGLDQGLGVLGFTFNLAKPAAEVVGARAVYGISGSAVAGESFARAEEGVVGQFKHAIPGMPRVAQLTTMLPGAMEFPAMREMAKAFGFRDMLAINASDGGGVGVQFNVFAPTTRALPEPLQRRYARIGAHIATAVRLRSQTAREELVDHAVLAPDGEVLHAERSARRDVDALTRGVRAVERARGPIRKQDPDKALEAWAALVEGRWSLVERVERDGKRFFIAHENPPELRDPRALTRAERSVVQLVALGHANKMVAYELGLSVGTVGRYLHVAMRKLGVRSRSALVREVMLLKSARAHAVDHAPGVVVIAASERAVPLETLTSAERDVARRAARGESNASIARARGASPSTVSNQLAGIYRKLGIGSRAELARLLG